MNSPFQDWKRHDIQVEHASLAAFEKGKGPPLLFLHGGPGDDCSGLLEWAEMFAGEHRCTLYDQRGSGRSNLSGTYSTETLNLRLFVDDIDRVLDHFGCKTAALAGHSWGSLLGLIYAIEQPERVDKLVLAGAGPMNEEFIKVAGENLNRGFSGETLAKLAAAKAKRRQAAADGNMAIQHEAQNEVIEVVAQKWVVNEA